MGEWVPLEVTEARLQWLVEKDLLPLKEVVGWRATVEDVLLFPQPNEVVSFIDFHERGFVIPISDFFHGFLYKYGIQLQHLPPNVVLQLARFIVVCEAFLGSSLTRIYFGRCSRSRPIRRMALMAACSSRWAG